MVSPYLLKDSTWIRQSFAVASSDLTTQDVARRTWSSASLKFTDTSLGGNFCINPPPQFTRTADIRPPTNRLVNSTGMGRYYSEAIDDNSQIIYMRFGVPEFNSLTTFFTGFYNTGAGQLARTGRATGIFYALGRAVGFVVGIMNWLPLAVHLLGVGLRFFLGKPSSKFYYLKPTMPLYWNAVQTIVNQIAVNRGIVPRLGGTTTADSDANPTAVSAVTNAAGQTVNLDNNYGTYWTDADRQFFYNNSPDIFTSGGTVNVWAMATRAMRLQHKQYKAIDDQTNSGSDLTTAFTNVMSQPWSDTPPDFQTYLASWAGGVDNNGNPSGVSAIPDAVPNADPTSGDNSTPDSSVESLDTLTTSDDGFFNFLSAEFDDGGEFAGFRVNATGSVGESFSNSVADSEIANKINSMSSSSRSTSFDFAGGDLIGGAAGAAIGAVVGAAKDVASGIADSLQVSGLAALAGAAFVDIPKHWESSSAQLPRASYTINLVSPYGNPMSQLMNIHIPLAMLLAAALPLSTGKQSYTSPFICELYDRGRCQTRLGIVDSLSVTRGTGNLGFTNEGHVMAIDVSFSVLDLSSVMHMPIAQSLSFSAGAVGALVGGAALGAVGAIGGFAAGQILAGTFDEDTVYTDYMAILGGMNLADQIYSWRKYKLNLTRQMTNFSTWYSWAHFASYLGNTPPGRLVSMIYKGVEH